MVSLKISSSNKASEEQYGGQLGAVSVWEELVETALEHSGLAVRDRVRSSDLRSSRWLSSSMEEPSNDSDVHPLSSFLSIMLGSLSRSKFSSIRISLASSDSKMSGSPASVHELLSEARYRAFKAC